MTHRLLPILTSVLLVTVAFSTAVTADHPDDEITVCHDASACDATAIQAAVGHAEPGDTIRILEGVYEENVLVTKPGLTLIGDGPGKTVLEGSGTDTGDYPHGIYVQGVDDVSVQSLTVQNYEDGFGVYFTGMSGFHVADVHAIDNGDYGIYAFSSQEGTFEDSVSTGHGDGGFYIGNVLECNCVLDNVEAHGNLIGYSGTASSHITIKHSHFHDNAAGVVPNVLPSQDYPQTDLTLVDNEIHDNNNHAMSAEHHVSGMHVPAGLGVIIAGGIQNTIQDNTITGHDRAGLAMVWLFTQPSLNQVTGNTFDNGNENQPAPSDLVPEDPVDILWDAGGVNNCFENNQRTGGEGITFDAGPAWNTLGFLPDCNTPNAGPPVPTSTARELSLLAFGCEPSEHLDEDTSVFTSRVATTTTCR